MHTHTPVSTCFLRHVYIKIHVYTFMDVCVYIYILIYTLLPDGVCICIHIKTRVLTSLGNFWMIFGDKTKEERVLAGVSRGLSTRSSRWCTRNVVGFAFVCFCVCLFVCLFFCVLLRVGSAFVYVGVCGFAFFDMWLCSVPR